MRRLPFLIILLFWPQSIFAQSPHGDNLDLDCSACHQPDNWQVIPEKLEFDHSETAFKLTGQHSSVNCRNCHTTLVFKNTPQDCFSCHKDIHQNTTVPDCSRCHTPQTWMVTNIYAVHQQSRFPLTGVHQITDCRQCHPGYVNLTFEPIGITCFNCHQQDYLNAKTPDHQAAGFSTDCSECHSINSFAWSARNFNHDFFPLQGGHNIQSCFTCHHTGTFTGLSKECYSCHRQDYESTDDPNHITAGFSTECTNCHNINDWDDADFDHTLTDFPLLGAHINVNCADCHQTGYNGISTECYSCHRQDYESENDPNHVAAGYPTDCTICHNQNNWEDADFDHNLTDFPLLGAHINVNCTDCHTTGYTGTSTVCYSCHSDAYEAAQNPDHRAAAIPSECNDCHTPIAWIPSTFIHAATGFVLDGQHALIQCSSCHKGIITGLTSACFSCHSDEYASAPEHSAQGYPTNCEMCHNTSVWNQTSFNHQNTSFPLTGAHIETDCQSCHINGFAGTSTICFDCHQTDYSTSVNPDHIAIQIPTDCQTCHTTNPDWQPALFPIHNNYYELLGAHSAIQNNCADCHQGNYTATPNTCIGCHADEYNSTTNPNHQTAGFPVECTSCHTQNAWIPANWNHDSQYFPIYSGKHAGTWNQCSDCHTNQADYSVFSCTNCHTQAETDNDHSEVPGYVYESSACLSCHPSGDSNLYKNLRHRIVN